MTLDLPKMVFESSIRMAHNPAIANSPDEIHRVLGELSRDEAGREALLDAIAEYRAKIRILQKYLRDDSAR